MKNRNGQPRRNIRDFQRAHLGFSYHRRCHGGKHDWLRSRGVPQRAVRGRDRDQERQSSISEVKLRIPRELNAREQEMRTMLRERFGRGAVDATVQLERQEGRRAGSWSTRVCSRRPRPGLPRRRPAGVENRFEPRDALAVPPDLRFEPADDLEELHAGDAGGLCRAPDQLSIGDGARARR